MFCNLPLILIRLSETEEFTESIHLHLSQDCIIQFKSLRVVRSLLNFDLLKGGIWFNHKKIQHILIVFLTFTDFSCTVQRTNIFKKIKEKKKKLRKERSIIIR